MSGREYKIAFDLPQSFSLCVEEMRDGRRETMKVMQQTGALSYDHLAEAVEAARGAGRGVKCSADRAKQSEIGRSAAKAAHMTLRRRRVKERDANRVTQDEPESPWKDNE